MTMQEMPAIGLPNPRILSTLQAVARIEELRVRFTQEPLGVALGAELADLSIGSAVVSVAVRDDFLIVDGIVQGGITTAVADFAAVYAAMSAIPSGHTPAEHISIDLFRPFKAGEVIFARARVVQDTRSSLWVNIAVTNAEGKDKGFARIHFSKPKM